MEVYVYVGSKSESINHCQTRGGCPTILQIAADDWKTAANTLTRCAFIVYLYLAQNAADYKFEFSPRAIEREGLMTHATAVKARQELEAKGYICGSKFYVQTPEKREQYAQSRQEINDTLGR